MKLVIDIPEHIWNTVINTGTFGYYRFNTSRAIRKGIPLEKIRNEIEAIPIPIDTNDTSDYQKGEGLIKEAVLNLIDKHIGNNETKDS